MAKKKFKDEWDSVDRDEQLAKIFSEDFDYQPGDEYQDGDVHNFIGDAATADDILRDMGFIDSSVDERPDDADEGYEVPTAPVHFPVEDIYGSKENAKAFSEAFDSNTSSLSYLAEMGKVGDDIDKAFEALENPTKKDDDDDDDENDNGYDYPEVSLVYNESANIVTFTDGYNTVSVNLSSLVRNGKFGKPNPDNVAQQIMSVINACITTTLPMRIINKSELEEVKSMTSKFNNDRYRFSEITIITKQSAYAVYKLAPDFFQVLERIIQYTTRNNVTMMFLKVLQNYCFDPNHTYTMSVSNADDWYSATNDEITDICGEFDWLWDVFFATDGADPISTQGGRMSPETIEERFNASMTEAGKFVSAELDSQILSSDDLTVMKTSDPVDNDMDTDIDMDCDDDDDENEWETTSDDDDDDNESETTSDNGETENSTESEKIVLSSEYGVMVNMSHDEVSNALVKEDEYESQDDETADLSSCVEDDEVSDSFDIDGPKELEELAAELADGLFEAAQEGRETAIIDVNVSSTEDGTTFSANVTTTNKSVEEVEKTELVEDEFKFEVRRTNHD